MKQEKDQTREKLMGSLLFGLRVLFCAMLLGCFKALAVNDITTTPSTVSVGKHGHATVVE